MLKATWRSRDKAASARPCLCHRIIDVRIISHTAQWYLILFALIPPPAQVELEKALRRRFPVFAGRCVGASRTDGGVHASGQVVHFDAPCESLGLLPELLQPSAATPAGNADGGCSNSALAVFASHELFLNHVLPPDVSVSAMRLAEHSFTGPAAGSCADGHATTSKRQRFDAQASSIGKEYRYRLAAVKPQPAEARSVWWVGQRWCERQRAPLPPSVQSLALDANAMAEAAGYLLGTHDFSAFMDTKRPSGPGNAVRKRRRVAAVDETGGSVGLRPARSQAANIRTLVRCEVATGADFGGITLIIVGDGFLYRMVRLIAAALVEVGHGRLSPLELRDLLESGDRSRLPIAAAPPHGLCLHRVFYPGEHAALDDAKAACLKSPSCHSRGETADAGDCAERQPPD